MGSFAKQLLVWYIDQIPSMHMPQDMHWLASSNVSWSLRYCEVHLRRPESIDTPGVFAPSRRGLGLSSRSGPSPRQVLGDLLVERFDVRTRCHLWNVKFDFVDMLPWAGDNASNDSTLRLSHVSMSYLRCYNLALAVGDDRQFLLHWKLPMFTVIMTGQLLSFRICDE